MVLNSELTKEEIERHRRLIDEGFKTIIGERPETIILHANGNAKGVYRVIAGDKTFLAAAASRDPKDSLVEEYSRLHQLYNNASNLFPRPIGHYSPQDFVTRGDVYFMELLAHKDIDQFKREGRPGYNNPLNFFRDLAREIGRVSAEVTLKTGMFSREPHNGNILLLAENDQLDLRLCDANQFYPGTVEDAVEAILTYGEERGECRRFIKQFREGLALGIQQNSDANYLRAWNSLEYLRRYNDVW